MKSLLRLLIYAKGWRRKIFAATVYSALNKLFDIAPEILIGVAVDVVVKREESFVAQLGFTSPQEQVAVLGVATFLIWALESLFEYLYSLSWRHLAQALQHALRMDAYNRVQQLDQAWFEEASVGNLLAILGDDVNQLERFLDTGANELIQVTVSSVLISAIFFFLSPLIAVMAVIPIPLIMLGSAFFQKNLGPRYAKVRSAAGALSATLANNIAGIATIKSFTREQQEFTRVEALSNAYQAANRSAIRLSSAFVPVIRIAILAGFLVTLVVGALKTFEGSLAVSAYSVLIFLTQRLLWPFTKLGQTVDLFERAMASANRILDLLETPFRITDPAQPRTLAAVKGALRFENLSFSYPNGAPVFKSLSLDVPAGTMAALVGGTGSGKTSLIKLLLRFYDPQDGSITLDGGNIQALRLADLRGQIGLVSQDVFLFQGTIFENIAYGLPGACEADVIAAAGAAEAHQFISQLPNGYQTVVGERGQKLSGGQRQRLSIARAILKQPPILIFDEATSAVDNETEAAIQHSLARLAKGRTVLVIAHRLSTIRAADCIHLLERGDIVESGTHDQLLAQNGVYARLWAIQTGAAFPDLAKS